MKKLSTTKAITIFSITMLLLITSKSLAQNYEVSGAGTSEANGVYVNDGTYSGKPHYTKSGSPTYYMYYIEMDGAWVISQNDNSYFWNSDYYNWSGNSTPPSSNWESWNGIYPYPTVSIAGPILSYSATAFTESSSNTGSIDNSSPITITHNNYSGGTFTGSNGDNFVALGKVTVTNLSSGLTAVITRTSSTVLSVSLTGNAVSHVNANDISNLTLTFQNSAFSTGDASSVTDAVKSNFTINFIEYLNVGSSQTYTTIASAVAAAGNGDVINLAAETFTENGISFSNKALRFVGQGAASTIIQGATSVNTATNRIFTITFPSYSASNAVSFENLTLRYGKKAMAPSSGSQGGAVYCLYGKLTITGCEIYNNIAAITTTDGWYAEGGGSIHLNQGTLIASNSTFSDNTFTSLSDRGWGDWMGGGAILAFLMASDQYMSLTNCTFSGNSSTVYGGAIFVKTNANSSIQVSNCTFANNSGGRGGAFSSDQVTGNPQPYDFTNTIFYGNTASNAGSQLWAQSTTYFTYNNCLIQTNNDGNIAGNYNSCLIGSNPLLSSLADNGGSTRTMALQLGSPAIDAGTASGAPSGDQRDYTRTGSIDIGAYEYNASPLPVELVSFKVNEVDGKVILNWATATEVNNYGFEVEKLKIKNQKSNSDIKWENIGFVKGNGNSNSAKEYSFIDDKISAGKYLYRLKQIDNDGKFEFSKEVEVEFGTPNEFSLNQNYPNPFNPRTIISYQLPVYSFVTLKIYDVLGNEVVTLVNENQSAGIHSLEFQSAAGSQQLASGIYFYKLSSTSASGSFVQTKKMSLLK